MSAEREQIADIIDDLIDRVLDGGDPMGESIGIRVGALYAADRILNLREQPDPDARYVVEPWSPIETAPAGVKVLVSYAGTDRFGFGALQPDGRWWHDCALLDPPTHWMPIPEPVGRAPESEEGGDRYGGHFTESVYAAPTESREGEERP